MKRDPGQVLKDLLKEKFPGTEVWVPGIENGSMTAVIELLNRLPDEEIVILVRRAFFTGAPGSFVVELVHQGFYGEKDWEEAADLHAEDESSALCEAEEVFRHTCERPDPATGRPDRFEVYFEPKAGRRYRVK